MHAQHTHGFVPVLGAFPTDKGLTRYRRLGRGDRAALGEHFAILSAHDRCARFGDEVNPDQIAAYCAHVDFDAMNIFGTFDDSLLVGVVELRPWADDRAATVALSVTEDHRRLGIGAGLLRVALACAGANGIARRLAYCLPDNLPMRRLMRSTGFTETAHEVIVIGCHEGRVDPTWLGAIRPS